MRSWPLRRPMPNFYVALAHATRPWSPLESVTATWCPSAKATKLDQLGAARPFGRKATKLRSLVGGGRTAWVSMDRTKMLSILVRKESVLEATALL